MGQTSLRRHWLSVIALCAALFVVIGLLLWELGILEVSGEQEPNAAASTTQSDMRAAAPHVPVSTAVEAPLINAKKATDTQFQYIEVTDGCDIHFNGDPCLNARSGPGTEYPVVAKLRNNMVLKVGSVSENEGHTWYKVVFDEYLRYPERITSDWYVAGDYVRVLQDDGDEASSGNDSASTSKRIIVDRSEQKLYAYDGDVLFMEVSISTGLALTPTPRGTFTVFKKTPSRYMQGPLPGLASDQYYDLPGVPWNLYFTQQGAVIHGAYWHDSFGHPYSHGCVNLLPSDAEKLYTWAPLGTVVIIKD